MAFTIPDDIVDKVREAANIVEVISDHVTLKQTGRNYKALCPFHPEKTPSFIVSPEKQIYHCFGCGAGGNVINFVMQFDSVSFPEAVRSLAKRYGIAVPRPAGSETSQSDFAFRANALAAKVYRAALLGTKEGTRARAYLRSRGIGEAVEKEFMIGYAPSEGNMLVAEARRQNVDLSKLVAFGLAVRTEEGARDLFRRRLMFPIITASGRILGFGGRVLDASEPKYLNSPETPVFKKSRTLYAIHSAKGEIRARGHAVVVEGYMDAIALHMSGIRNTVASLGTAFTADQARGLRRYSEHATLVYDGDDAGRAAALRALLPAAEAGLRVKVATLPPGEDPDSYVRKRGPAAVEALLAEAAYYVDFILSSAVSDDVEDSIRFALGVIMKITEPIRASLDIKRLADRSGVPESVLTRSLARLPDDKRSTPPKEVATDTCDRLEKSIISILVGLPQYADRILEEVSPSDFSDHRMRRIAELVADRRSRSLDVDASALLSVTDEAEIRSLLVDCSLGDDLTGDCERIVSDHIQCMKRRIIARQVEALRAQIQAAEKEGDSALLEGLLSKRQHLARQLRELST